MRFDRHFHERLPFRFRSINKKTHTPEFRDNFFSLLEATGLDGVTEADSVLMPRLLPYSYLKTIEKMAREVCEFCFRLVNLPENEVRSILPEGPINQFLLNEIKILKHRPRRLIGSLRLDAAIVGVPGPRNPPKLLEINEIGFDGLARNVLLQNVHLALLPELHKQVVVLDSVAAELRNFKRLGRHLARVQYESYNWDEEAQYLAAKAADVNFDMISPSEFDLDIEAYPLLRRARIQNDQKGNLFAGKGIYPDAIQMSYALGINDYIEAERLVNTIVRSKTPQYGPFVLGLISTKLILALLHDPVLRRKLLGSATRLESSILPAFSLPLIQEEVEAYPHRWVIKHADGYGGYHVFIDRDLIPKLKKIKKAEAHEWVAQRRAALNTMHVRGMHSRPRRVITDLGIFVHYDWSNDGFKHFEVGGFISRATNRSFKVNVSGGGLQVPVLFMKGE